MADYMLALNEDGSVRSAGPIEDVLGDEELAEVKEEETEEVVPAEDLTKPEERKAVPKLIQAEEKAEGRISRRAMISFFA
jgi:ABC-type molybdate transport system ATPase subunit